MNEGVAPGVAVVLRYTTRLAKAASRFSFEATTKSFFPSSSKSQRLEFIQAFKDSLLDTYTSTLAQWGDQRIVTVFPEVSEIKKTEDVKQNLITASNIYPITYKVRKNKNGDWLIINIIVNGVNLGLTFRNQFQALAKEHNENIDEIIKHWTSDAGLN